MRYVLNIGNLVDISGTVIRYIFLATVIGFIVPLLLLFLIADQISFTADTYHPLWALLASILVGIPVIFAYFVAGSAALYYSVIVIIVFLAIISLLHTNGEYSNRILAVITLVAVIIFMFIPYQTAVQPSVGYTVTSPTQPQFLGHSLRNLQILGEISPCSYQLLGWKEQDLLYEETCNAKSSIYQFNPQTEQTRRVDHSPAIDTLYINPTAHIEILDLFQAKGVSPAEAEPAAIEFSIRGNALPSTDDKWLAVLARHVYGPEDILVIAQHKH